MVSTISPDTLWPLTTTGSVVRITPDEVHVLDPVTQLHVDSWVKGTGAIESQPGRGVQNFQIQRRSISRVSSMLRVEINRIISGLVEKHHVPRVVVSTKLRPKFPREPKVQIGDSDLEHEGFKLS
jgi:hypothetical protein